MQAQAHAHMRKARRMPPARSHLNVGEHSNTQEHSPLLAQAPDCEPEEAMHHNLEQHANPLPSIGKTLCLIQACDVSHIASTLLLADWHGFGAQLYCMW